jgi:hypothetical protein
MRSGGVGYQFQLTSSNGRSYVFEWCFSRPFGTWFPWFYSFRCLSSALMWRRRIVWAGAPIPPWLKPWIS